MHVSRWSTCSEGNPAAPLPARGSEDPYHRPGSPNPRTPSTRASMMGEWNRPRRCSGVRGDALRGVAIVLVVVFHALNYGLADNRFRGLGSAGVALFFALSGYLITSLFTAEPRLGRFYRNRAVRLDSGLGFAILGYCALQAWLHVELIAGDRLGDRLSRELGTGQWTRPRGLRPHVVPCRRGAVLPGVAACPAGHPTSPTRPAVDDGRPARRVTTVARFTLMPLVGETHVYMGSETASASLLVGCLLALLLKAGGWKAARVPGWVLAVGSAGLLVLATFEHSSWGYAVMSPPW